MFRATSLAIVLLLAPSLQAADTSPINVPWWAAAPFVVLLLCIAVLPLAAEHWWHDNRNKALVAFPLAVIVAIYLVTLGQPGVDALVHELAEYFSFIVLLWSLYTISGGIVIEGDFRGTPANNAILLLIGTCLASFIGTTGASMLLIRPFLRMNRGRKRTAHLPVFFIFMVSNTGGLLTPLGDPPLFLGFLKGVDFFWPMQNLKFEWLIVNGLLLVVFFVWDTLAVRVEELPPLTADAKPLRVQGLPGFALLAGVLGAVVSKGYLVGTALEPFFLPEIAQIAFGVSSLAVTPGTLRQANRFSWVPIVEVAVLFIGIFVAMVPALELLKLNGDKLTLTAPWQYFWLTGGLSSCLDNAPTYVTFGTLAAGPGASDFSVLMSAEKADVLAAISCGAVFMGALTYIGNGPNFMVKAMAEEDGYKMPSFFGYMVYSILVLVPVFAVVTFVLFI
jgi:Na+/H+ antiporter NhaD/arsenite permease-like protein